MTERRPHWDASLISAVLADLRDVYDSGYGEEQAFRIIAAVEDWVLSARRSKKYDAHWTETAMSERLLAPVVNRATLHPSEVGLTFWVDPRTNLTEFLKAGLEELLRVWDAQQAQMDGDSDE